MNKKIFNWLGYIIVFAYIVIFVILLLLGLYMDKISEYGIRNCFYSATLLWGIVILAIIPTTLHKALGKLLPIKHISATVLNKHEEGRKAYFSNGITSTTIKAFVTF